MLFTFPSLYCFTIGRQGVFRLGGLSPHLQSGFLVSRPTLDTAVSTQISPTGLSPSLTGFPKTIRLSLLNHVCSPNPVQEARGKRRDARVQPATLISFLSCCLFLASCFLRLASCTVWPFPISLATTLGISVDFFSCGYLDVSVLHVSPRMAMYSPYDDGGLLRRVSPFGHPRIADRLRLPVAFRCFLRPSSALGA